MWDSYDRLAPILRDLGIDPDAAFKRLEWLGRPYDKDELARFARRLNRIDSDDCPCDACGLRRLKGWDVR